MDLVGEDDFDTAPPVIPQDMIAVDDFADEVPQALDDPPIANHLVPPINSGSSSSGYWCDQACRISSIGPKIAPLVNLSVRTQNLPEQKLPSLHSLPFLSPLSSVKPEPGSVKSEFGKHGFSKPESRKRQREASDDFWRRHLPPTFAHESGVQIDIKNVVGTVNLGVKNLDLKLIARTVRNAEYNPRRMHNVVIRLQRPRTTLLVAASGILKCMGGVDEHSAKVAIRKGARKLQRAGYPAIKFLEYRVQVLSASCNLGFPINLAGLATEKPEEATYEPELFCGVTYRLTTVQVTLRIYASGKMTFWGAKSRRAVYFAFGEIYPLLFKHRLSDPSVITPDMLKREETDEAKEASKKDSSSDMPDLETEATELD